MCKYNEDELIIGTPRFLKYKKLFAEAGELAAEKAMQQGLAITCVENDQIIVKYPNGKRKVLGEAPKRIKYSEFIIKLHKNNVKTKRRELVKK